MLMSSWPSSAKSFVSFEYSSCSPDLNIPDFFLWWFSRTASTKICTIAALKVAIAAKNQVVTQEEFECVVNNFASLFPEYLRLNGGHVKCVL